MTKSTVQIEGDRVTVTTGSMRTVFRSGDDNAAAGQVALLQQEVERLRSSQSLFLNDPFAIVATVFTRLFPNTPVECQWVDDLHDKDGDPWAQAIFRDNEVPMIIVDGRCPLIGATELLAHELAHVACAFLGLENPRTEAEHEGVEGQHWRDILDKIHAAYCEEAKKRAEESREGTDG